MVSYYLNAVEAALHGKPRRLKPFIGQSVTDIDGKVYPLETDPNMLLALNEQATYEEIYRPTAM